MVHKREPASRMDAEFLGFINITNSNMNINLGNSMDIDIPFISCKVEEYMCSKELKDNLTEINDVVEFYGKCLINTQHILINIQNY